MEVAYAGIEAVKDDVMEEDLNTEFSEWLLQEMLPISINYNMIPGSSEIMNYVQPCMTVCHEKNLAVCKPVESANGL